MGSLSIGKIAISNAVPKRKCKVNLGGQVVTTFDFCHNKIVFGRELVPNDELHSLSINHNIRMSPMAAPTIGKARLKFREFFVPARLAYKGFERFMEGRVNHPSIGVSSIPELPKSRNDLMSAAFMSSYGIRVGSASNYHFPATNFFSTPRYAWLGQNSFLTSKTTGNTSTLIDEPLCEVVAIGETPTLPLFAITDGRLSSNTLQFKKSLISDPSSIDYDFSGMFASEPSVANSGKIKYVIYPFQLNASYFDGGVEKTDNTKACPYVFFRLTSKGKRFLSFLQDLGYNPIWCCPYYNIARADKTDTIPNTSTYTGSNTINNNGGINYSTRYSWSPAEGLGIYGYGMTVDNNAAALNPCTIEWDPQGTNAGLNTSMETQYFNMMRPQSVLRAYVDHMAPTQWLDVYTSKFDAWFGTDGFLYTMDRLTQLCDVLITSYDKDYFTSAWQYPNSPTNSTRASIGSLDLSGHGSTSVTAGTLLGKEPSATPGGVISDLNGNYLQTTEGNSTENYWSVITSIGLRALQAIDKYKREYNISGMRWIDNQLARYGIRPSDARVDRAELLDVKSSEFDISLVMSTAETNQAALGDYAAHGESRNSIKMAGYKATEFGFVFVIASLVPKALYFQGRDRENTYKNRTDLFSPEFDEVDSMQAIRSDELQSDTRHCNDIVGARKAGFDVHNTFGYTRSWAELKLGRDRVTGDFRLNRSKYTTDAYFLGRILPQLVDFKSTDLLINSKEFNEATDGYQYDRIFQMDGNDYDHFYMFAVVDAICSRPMKSITDYTMDDDDSDSATKMEMFGHQV